jgi:hypothetical protein
MVIVLYHLSLLTADVFFAAFSVLMYMKEKGKVKKFDGYISFDDTDVLLNRVFQQPAKEV